MITPIVEGESGLSVRNKLNALVDVANIGSTFVTAYSVVQNNASVAALLLTYKINTATRIGAASILINFDALTTANYGVVITPIATSAVICSVEQKTTSSFVVRTRTISGTNIDCDFSVFIFGG